MGDSQQPRRGSVVIVGSGTQGRRLAYMWSSRGGVVYIVGKEEKQLQDSLAYVHQVRESAVDHAGNWGDVIVAPLNSMPSTLKDAWLVVECVTESLSLKKSVISQLDRDSPKETIIASNSSSYGISTILDGMELLHPERIMSAHCYWPPEISAIEIMGHKNTDPSKIATLMEQCAEHGFLPFHVKKDSMGYIYNRIWSAIKRETLLLLEEGVCAPQEVDSIFREVLQTPKGPCELMDKVGLDVVLEIEENYAKARSGIPPQPREFVQKMIQDGKLGMKSGKEFYDYSKS